MRITEASVEKLTFRGKRPDTADIRRDDRLSGFCVRVYPSGRKYFMVRIKKKGQRFLRQIGPWPAFSADDARKRAAEIIREIEMGKDPFASQAAGITWDDYAVVYMKRRGSQKKSGWQDDYRMKKHLLPRFGKLDLKALTRASVASLYQEVGETSPHEANQLLALVSTLWNRAVEWGYLEPEMYDKNPTRWLKRFKTQARERFVTADEMPRLLAAIEREPDKIVRSLLKLFLLTGLRRTELLTIQWDFLDLKAKQLKLKDTKAGRPHYLPLPDAAVELFKGIPKRLGSPYVFNAPRSYAFKPKPMTHYSIRNQWNRIREESGLQDVTLHDLRRTVGSWMAMSGESLPMIGQVLNHSNQRTTEIYARFHQDPVREALEKLSQKILAPASDGVLDVAKDEGV